MSHLLSVLIFLNAPYYSRSRSQTTSNPNNRVTHDQIWKLASILNFGSHILIWFDV